MARKVYKFIGNKCNNVLLDTRATNMGRVIVEGNTFEGARGNLEEVMWPKNKPGAPAGDRPPKDKWATRRLPNVANVEVLPVAKSNFQ